MNQTQIVLLCLCGAFFLVIAVIAAIGNLYSLKGIPNKSVGCGQQDVVKRMSKGAAGKSCP